VHTLTGKVNFRSELQADQQKLVYHQQQFPMSVCRSVACQSTCGSWTGLDLTLVKPVSSPDIHTEQFYINPTTKAHSKEKSKAFLSSEVKPGSKSRL